MFIITFHMKCHLSPSPHAFTSSDSRASAFRLYILIRVFMLHGSSGVGRILYEKHISDLKNGIFLFSQRNKCRKRSRAGVKKYCCYFFFLLNALSLEINCRLSLFSFFRFNIFLNKKNQSSLSLGPRVYDEPWELWVGVHVQIRVHYASQVWRTRSRTERYSPRTRQAEQFLFYSFVWVHSASFLRYVLSILAFVFVLLSCCSA